MCESYRRDFRNKMGGDTRGKDYKQGEERKKDLFLIHTNTQAHTLTHRNTYDEERVN